MLTFYLASYVYFDCIYFFFFDVLLCSHPDHIRFITSPIQLIHTSCAVGNLKKEISELKTELSQERRHSYPPGTLSVHRSFCFIILSFTFPVDKDCFDPRFTLYIMCEFTILIRKLST